MSKIFMLKPWVSISEAADYLSEERGEEITIEHILQFGLDGYLKLSVKFPQDTIVQRVVIKSTAPLNGHIPKTIGQMEPIGEIFDMVKNEVYDLAMIGGEREFVANYLNLYRDTPIEFHVSTSPIIIENQNGEMFCLITRCLSNPYNQYVPATTLSESLYPVVRPKEIDKTIQILDKRFPTAATITSETFIEVERKKGTHKNIIAFLLSSKFDLKDHQVAEKLNISPGRPYETRCSTARTNIARGKAAYLKNKQLSGVCT